MTHISRPLYTLFLTLSLCVYGCNDSSIPGNDGGGADSGGVDVGMSCDPIVCTAPCRSYVENGCQACYCPPADECAADGDCVLGNLTGVCCGGCTGAFARGIADENICVVEVYTPASSECVGIDCDAVDCPAIACAQATRAVCNAGSCEARSDCAAGDVMTRFGCAPACTIDADCAIKTGSAACCGDCQAVVHTAASPACFFGADERPGPECLPDRVLCTETACPEIACEELGAAICDIGTGLCEARIAM